MAYTLEIKQIVDYPRIRIHRELIQKLLADESLSRRGDCHLFSFMVLCSYANFRSSRLRIDGVSHLIGPGEWICSLREMAGWFGCSRLYQATAILEELVQGGFLTFRMLPGTKLVHYQILNWGAFNTVLEYECRCQKDCGFFFFPISFGKRLMEDKRCSERDILMDLWLNTIYKDERIKGSEIGPVVYFRDGSDDPLTSCSSLALRWGVSKTTASRILARLDRLGYLNVLTFPGRHGTILYLENYLSVMFQISDLPINKEEVALRLQLKAGRTTEESCVPSEKISVSKHIMLELLPKLLQSLAAWGFFCCSCKKKSAKLYPLSAACDRWMLEVSCKSRMASADSLSRYCFEVRVTEGSG
jgi:DNA-binding IscR family transcriptional regulator